MASGQILQRDSDPETAGFSMSTRPLFTIAKEFEGTHRTPKASALDPKP